MISKFRIHNSEFKQKGLSLIEMTIAIAILIVALLAALALATFGVVAGGESEMRVTAINLAREGVEVVRNKRDSNWLAVDDWIKGENLSIEEADDVIIGNSVPVFSGNTWQLKRVISAGVFVPTDPKTITNILWSPIFTKDMLYLQDTATISGANPTNFYRFIDIEEVTAGTELKVTCYVAYQERGRWHLVNVEEHLFNWY